MDGQLVVVRIVDKTDRMPKFHSLHLRIGPHKHVNKFADKNSGKNLENVIVSTDSYCMERVHGSQSSESRCLKAIVN